MQQDAKAPVYRCKTPSRATLAWEVDKAPEDLV